MKYVRTTRTVNPETTIVFCQGEMSTLAVEELHQAVDPLVEDTTRHLILELREVKYVSSSVLQFLIEANDRLKKRGGRTSLVGAGSLVCLAFQTARLDSLFEFCETLEELGITPPAPSASKPTLVPPAGPSGKPAPPGPSDKPTPTRPASRSSQVREKTTPAQAVPAGKPVEKIFPRPRPVRDAQFYRFWGGLAALIVGSLLLSLYLYLAGY